MSRQVPKGRLILVCLLPLVGLPSTALAQCTDADGDGFFYEPGCGTAQDCNDADSTTHPGGAETCDGYDNDCDGVIDNTAGCSATCYLPQETGDEVRLTFDPALSDFPRIVWTGSDYGVFWVDDREDEIYFTRVDAWGNKLSGDVRVSQGAHDAGHPSPVWTGSEYAVAWRDGRWANEINVYFARLDASGNRIGWIDILVAEDAGNTWQPSLVWTGSTYGVAWSQAVGTNDEIYFRRLDAAGSLISLQMRLTDDPARSDWPTLVWTGSEYAVAWRDTRDGNEQVYFARLDASGNKIGADVRVSDGWARWRPSLVWTGTEYGVVWGDTRDGNDEIYFARLDASGNKIGGDVRVTYDVANGPADVGVSLVWTGSEYGLSWMRGKGPASFDVYFGRLDAAGNLVGRLQTLATDVKAGNGGPDLAWSGGEYGLVWSDPSDEIHFGRIECGCSPGDTFDGDGDGVACDTDCDDQDAGVYPGAPEICDGVGNDCNAPSWPPLPPSEADSDIDGFTICEDDCDDADPAIHPAAAPLDSATACMKDADNDDYGDAAPPDGVTAGTDCDDSDAAVNPGTSEIGCDEVDNDCDAATLDEDADGDGVRCPRDCDDANSTVFPHAPEICDGINNDCKDPNWPELPPNESDADADGYRVCEGDCEDTVSSVNPAATEIGCDGIDNDCNPDTSEFFDIDGDGSDCDVDCNEADPSVHPGAAEVCDGFDTDCDGQIDNDPACDTTCALPGTIGFDTRVTDTLLISAHPSLVWTGAEFGVAWYEGDYYDVYLYFSRLDTSGNKIGGEVEVSFAGCDYGPALIWTGAEYGVAFKSGCLPVFWELIGFARLDAFGNKIGGTKHVIDAPDQWSDVYGASIAWSGTEFGVAWSGGGGPHFARLDAWGNKIGTEVRVPEAASGRYPDLVWIGSEYGVVWDSSFDGNREIYFARLDASGNKVGNDVRITDDPAASENPSLAWTGSEYGVAWFDDRDGNPEVYFARLDASGNKVGNDLRITDDPAASENPSLVWTGSEYGVAWFDGRDGDGEIYFVRLDATGSKLGSDIRVSYEPGSKVDPSLVWTGSEYGVAWGDTRDDNEEIYFARLGCDCIDGDGDGSSVCEPDCDDTNPAIHPRAAEVCNGIDDDCNALIDEDANGEDSDGDLVANLCDNCVFDSNPSQSDFDGDQQGDRCDLDDGRAYLFFNRADAVEWDQDTTLDGWNCYRGDLDVLRATGVYTQLEGSNDLASQNCGLTVTWLEDSDPLAKGQVAFYLTSGTSGGIEGSLGTDSAGNERSNDNPCP